MENGVNRFFPNTYSIGQTCHYSEGFPFLNFPFFYPTLMCALNLNHKSVHICSCSLRTIAFWADLNYLRFSNAASLEEQERLLCYAGGRGEKKSQSDNLVTWLLVHWYSQEKLSLELVNAPYNTKYSLQ